MTNSAPSSPAENKPPRVAIVYRLYQPGGVQSVVLSLIKGLNARGITPDIVWDTPPSQKMLDEKGLRAGFQHVRFPVNSALLDRLPITLAYLMRVFNTFSTRRLARGYDFYYIFANGFLVRDGAPHLRYLSGPPLIAALEAIRPGWHGWPFRLMNAFYRLVLRHWLPAYEFHRDSRYVINAEFTAGLFEDQYGVRLPVINPPIDLSGRSFHDDDLAQRDTITFFSRMVDFKRPEMFLELACRYPNRRFVMMGGVKPAQRAYVDALRHKSPGENLVFIENPSDQQVKTELARTRVYVFPAVEEHFGMATAEAIGSGAIPYVHDSGGQREVVPDPRLRFHDERFFSGFEDILNLPDPEINAIRHNLRQHVERFSEDAFLEKMLAVLPQDR